MIINICIIKKDKEAGQVNKIYKTSVIYISDKTAHLLFYNFICMIKIHKYIYSFIFNFFLFILTFSPKYVDY